MYIAPALLYRAALGVLAIVCALFSFKTASEYYVAKPIAPPVDFAGCMRSTEAGASVEKADLEQYKIVWNICDVQIYQELEYDDYAIRKEKFRQQEFDERINLWLVVLITFSGVFLAGVQLVMSYRLALRGLEAFGTDAELVAEQGKISFRSSVTGLSILAISLAFFFIYVQDIYKDQEIGAKPAQLALAPAPKGKKLDAQGLWGLPPAPNPSPSPPPSIPAAATSRP